MEKILTDTTLPGRTASHAYRPDIDGLRTVAVLLVVLFHAWPNWLKSGFIGVDIFFVISGFLITSVIIENVAQRRFSISGFYARRVLRIFPALILVLGITLLAGWALLLRGELHQLGKHVASGAAFIANLTLWSEVGYFDNDSSTKPLLHLWSLGVEEQFYILWPLIVWGIYRYKLGFLKISSVVFALSFGYSLYTTFHAPTESYFSPVTRFWELMAGGISAHLLRHHAVRVAKHAAPLTWCGAAMILVAAVFVTEQSPFPGWWALAPVLGTCALLLAGERAWVNRNILSQPIASRTGLVSYPFYLWHWPLLSFAFIVYGEKPPASMKAVLVVAALVLAVLTYQLLELPLKRFKRRRTLIAALCVGMAALAMAGLLAARGQIAPRVKSGSAEPILNALNDVDFPTAAMTPYPYQGQTFQQVRGSGSGATVLIGDSVMEQYGAFVSNWLRLNSPQRRAVIFATAGGCPPIRGAVRLPRLKFPSCPQTVDAAHALAVSAEVDTVVIGAAWYGYFNDQSHSLAMGNATFPAAAAQERAYTALKSSLESFAASGKRVYLVLSPPAGLEFDPRSMIQGSRLSGEVSARRDIAAFDGAGYRARNKKAIDRLTDIARASGATVIDPMLSLCPGMRCPVLDAIGEPVYTDSVHIRPGFSLTGAAYLAPTLQDVTVL